MELSSKHFILNITDENNYLEQEQLVFDHLLKLFTKLDSMQSVLSVNNFEKIIIELSIVSDKAIQEINHEYRDKDKATDVLSFPSQENIRADEYEILNDELIVGDILICHEICLKQALEHKITYKDEFLHLFVHGLLHLYGYDHEISESEEKLMEAKEKKLIELLK